MKRFVKRYASDPKAVRIMRADIVGFARTCGFSDPEINEIAMASGEAFVNAVEHGHVPGSSVDVKYSSDERALTISIKDAGGGLDPEEKTWNSVVNKPFPGGYGRLMMRALMDEVFTHIDPGDGTTVVMRKEIDCPAGVTGLATSGDHSELRTSRVINT
jgi:anti-sigma regulatory factor (Ser/Thr protein kinase)